MARKFLERRADGGAARRAVLTLSINSNTGQDR